MKKKNFVLRKFVTSFFCLALLSASIVNAETVDVTYQGEDFTSASGCYVGTYHSGYTGSGYINWAYNGWGEWNNINIPGSGTITMTLRYANGATTNRTLSLTVNGVSQGNVSFAPTGVWTSWSTVSVDIPVNSGNNTIRFAASSSSGPNIDYLQFTGTVGGAADTEAPSVPTGLAAGTITTNSVALSWNASTDNVGVTGYKVYTNGSNPATVTGTSTTITGLSTSTQYSFTVSAIDEAENESAQSSAVNATTASPGTTSSSTWQSFAVSTLTGTFTATFDAVPNGTNIDALTGILNGTASAYSDVACIVRFNSNGQIDARDGDVYDATNGIYYSSGVSYHFRVEINIPAHTYSVYATPQGGSEQIVASNFEFRSEQASVSQLTGWTLYAYIGSHSVSNMTFTTTTDTQAPSVPTGLATGTITSSSVALSWNASTDNVGVTEYKVYTNGSNPVTVAGTSTTITGLSASTSYSFTVSAVDAASNESTQSSSVNATTSTPTGITSSTTWQSFTVSTQTGVFTATFDAIPNGSSIDALTGILNGSASSYGDVACIIRFYTNGLIDARNGGTYAATNSISYTSGVSYHFRVEISVPTHTYSVYVTPQGGSEQTVASNFAFRSEQASVSQLTGWTLYGSSGTHTVSNVAFTLPVPDTEVPSVPTGLASSGVYSSGFTLSWNPSTDNVAVTGYEVFKDGTSIGTTTSTSMTVTGLSPETTYSMKVRARDAVPNWSAQSSALNVTTTASSGGGDWPNASNTGYTGTLTNYSGNLTASTNGQVIQNLNISGNIYIKANNVTIRNCKFNNLDIATADNYTGCVVEDCNLKWAGRHHFTLRRCELNKVSDDLIRVSKGHVTIEDCYLHLDGPSAPGSHADILQEYPVGQGYNVVMRHNTCYIAMQQNSVVISVTQLLFENNLVAGGSYPMNVNSGNTVINNRFSTKYYSTCGYYGIFHGSPGTCYGNVWHETGAPVSCPSSANIELTENVESSVKIYPNPLNSNTLKIQLNNIDTDVTNINIIDLTGRTVYNQLHETQSELNIPVNNLSKGIYIISVNGNQQKLVIE